MRGHWSASSSTCLPGCLVSGICLWCVWGVCVCACAYICVERIMGSRPRGTLRVEVTVWVIRSLVGRVQRAGDDSEADLSPLP